MVTELINHAPSAEPKRRARITHRSRRPYQLPEPLKCDPDVEVTMDLVEKYIQRHENRIPRYDYLEALYKGFFDLFSQPEKPDWKPDNRLAVNFPYMLTRSFAGYGYGNPIKVFVDGDGPQEALTLWEDACEIDDHNSEMVKACCIYGHGWEYFYQDEESQTHVKRFKPKGLFVVYDEDLKQRAKFMVRYGRHELDDGSNGERYGEVCTREWIREFRGSEWSGDPEPNPYGMIPCVEWIFNEERIGLFETIANMTEVYSHVVGEKANDVDAFAEAYMVVLGAELDEEGVYRIRDDRIINFYGTDDAKDILVSFLTKPTADDTQENLLNRLEKLIFLISMVANFSDETFGNATSGVSLAYKLLDMNNLMADFNRKISKSIKKRVKIWSSLSTNVPDHEIWKTTKIQIVPNVPKNKAEETETAQAASGLVSKRTQLSLLSYVDDVDAELEEIAKERDEEAQTDQARMENFTYSFGKGRMVDLREAQGGDEDGTEDAATK